MAQLLPLVRSTFALLNCLQTLQDLGRMTIIRLRADNFDGASPLLPVK